MITLRLRPLIQFHVPVQVNGTSPCYRAEPIAERNRLLCGTDCCAEPIAVRNRLSGMTGCRAEPVAERNRLPSGTGCRAEPVAERSRGKNYGYKFNPIHHCKLIKSDRSYASSKCGTTSKRILNDFDGEMVMPVIKVVCISVRFSSGCV